ncbi:TerC family protein [Dongia soli]|uniref:TerC family protein n=1 Tax=Dongia soli TaxID=600628 RepID=A0ABU5E4I7_9PROT|nr:TerC family protein [Dongia soli]MDY0881222.1 TerC family protein [Dongia soli]
MPTFNDFLPELIALGQVILVDLVLAGDNAIVVGMAAAGLPRQQRNRAILIGIVAATLLRVIFALITNQLLMIIGLTLAGGILLLWVCWKFWRELMQQRRERLELKAREHLSTDESIELSEPQEVLPGATPGKTLRQAITQIVVADVSMSLDNVLAVAGAAREHTWVLIFGLVLSVGLMGAAATLIAKLLKKHHWIAYIGLAVIFYVACKMIWDGWFEVVPHMQELTDFK